jgi:hypothetical protein
VIFSLRPALMARPGADSTPTLKEPREARRCRKATSIRTAPAPNFQVKRPMIEFES